MHGENKDKKFDITGKYLLNGCFFDSISKSRVQNPTKSLSRSFFAKTVNDFQLLTFFAKEPHHENVRLCFKNATVACNEKGNKLCYMILHNFT